MQLFRALEGLSGEQLATGGLRLLLLRSQACRDAFLKPLANAFPAWPLSTTSHFSCYAEYATTDEVEGRGRIDLILELDDAVVGVEVKLGAALQSGQPRKYVEELDRVAGLLGQVRRREMPSLLTVLAPGSRRTEVNDILAVVPRSAFLAWEDVLTALRDAEGGDQFVSVLIAEFDQYLRDALDFLPRFAEWAPRLRAAWKPGGTAEQHKLLRALSTILPGRAGRMAGGDSWVGYYFTPDGPDAARSWIGFLPSSRADRRDEHALLVVSTSRPVVPQATADYSPVHISPPNNVDGLSVDSWEIRFNPSWTTAADWTGRLAIFLSQPTAHAPEPHDSSV